jgi:hypothetical protein
MPPKQHGGARKGAGRKQTNDAKGTSKLATIFHQKTAAAETGGSNDATIPVYLPYNVAGGTVVNPYSEESKAARRKIKETEKTIAVFLTLKRRDDDAISWVLFEGDKETKHGLIQTKENYAVFMKACKKVATNRGFLISFGFEALRMEAISNTNYPALWRQCKKCNLDSFYLQLLVDNDLYKPLTLVELYDEMYCREEGVTASTLDSEDDVFPETSLMGRCFHWFLSRFENSLLTVNVPEGNTPVCANFNLINRVGIGGGKPRVNKDWDTALELPCKEIGLEDLKYVVFDVETHDWKEVPGFQLSTRANCIGRVVEIAWIAFDSKGSELERKNYLVKPYGYEKISRKALNFHGISTRCAEEKGSPVKFVFARFAQVLERIPSEGFVIAHNMHHEDSVMANNFDEEQLALWERLPKVCTWNPDLLSLLPRQQEQRTYGMALKDLHGITSPSGLLLRHQAHEAFADARMAWDVFYFFKQALEKKGLDVSENMLWKRRALTALGKRKSPPRSKFFTTNQS